ncbi:Gfo/Idh/MocA family protein [Parafrigoribacterium soli]|uniref:Gfo/Idh/MocA family protein n=1 Tax=Parafrigoribacterium soli TaxID=3144663 RepID=UPI0032EF59BA
MPNTSPIRTGIIGFGLSGRVFHAPFVATNPAYSLDLITTSDPGRAADARRMHPGAEILETPAQLLAKAKDLDLVILASPAHVHLEHGRAALDAGAALVIDKPFAASVDEAEQLITAAEAAGRPLAVFQNRRWDGDFLTVKKLLTEGRLGAVHRFESTFERWSPALRDRWQDTTTIAQGAGITFDLGSHLVDQALHLFGPATVEHAELSIIRDGGTSDDEAFISLMHEGGVRSHLTMSRVAAQSGPRFRVLGSAAAYVVHGVDSQEPFLKAGALPTDEAYGIEPESAWGLVGIDGSANVPLTRQRTERGDYPAFYAGLAATIRDGAPLPVDPRESLETLRILARAHELSGL